MRFGVIGMSGRNVTRLAAILATGTMLAGCSSGVSRFTDDMFTGSTDNQRSIIGKTDQPFPGDVNASSANGGYAPVAAAPAQPVQRGDLPPVTASAPPAPAPTSTTRAVWQTGPAPIADRASVDTSTVTGAVAAAPAAPAARPVVTAAAPAPVAAAETAEAGWSRAGGTEITVRDGETVYNLAKRYGVPATAIVKANGLSSADALRSGQRVVIPTYVYSRRSPVSAPDATPEVAEAKSSRGSQFDVASQNVPVPSRAPQQTVAVLPEAPKPREKASSAAQPPAAATAAPTPNARPAVNVAAAGLATAAAPKAEPAVLAAPAVASGGYEVVSGDSLYAIAKKTGVSVAEIKAANTLADKPLKIGQKLVIPATGASQLAKAAPAKVDPVVTSTAKVAKPVETAQPSPVTAYTPPKQESKALEEAVQTAAIAPEATGVGRMRWPVRGRVINEYGRSGGKSSDGIDIAVPEGTSVKAAENGVVIYAGDGLKEFGNTVLVRHEDGLVTVYGHASELKVGRGDKVRRGQEIARSGMSGAADMPKLHFEVRKDSTPVDPKGFLE